MSEHAVRPGGSWGRWLRVGLGAVVLGFAAMPAARVYMYNEPMLQHIELLDGDDEINSLSGAGLPNSIVQVWYRQRNFHQGDKDGVGPQFSWCGGYNSGWIHAGTALTNQSGGWTANVKNSQITVYPSIPWINQDPAPCGAGLVTEFRLIHTTNPDPAAITSTAQVPDLMWFRIKKPANGDQTGLTAAVVENAFNSSVSVADGLNDANSSNGKTKDTNQSGFDCMPAGAGPCPRRIEFKPSGGDRPAPSISVVDNSTFPNDLDPEFVSILGQMFANTPGGSILAAGKRDRPNPLGPSVIRIRIGAQDISCDPVSLFDFFF